MKNFIKTLDEVAPKNSTHKSVKKLAFFLSGQSNFDHCGLDKKQKKLLQIFKHNEFNVIEEGFPFSQQSRLKEFKKTNLILASIRNIQQFFYLLHSHYYRELVAKHLQPLFYTSKEIFIVCQSLGLYMLHAVSSLIKINNNTKITIIAYGPVVFGKFNDSRFKLYVIKGRYDFISMLLDRHPVDHWLLCNHIGYFEKIDSLKLIKKILKNEQKNSN